MDKIIVHALYTDICINFDSTLNTDEFNILNLKNLRNQNPHHINRKTSEPNFNNPKYNLELNKSVKPAEPGKYYLNKYQTNLIQNNQKYIPKFGVFDFLKKKKLKREKL